MKIAIIPDGAVLVDHLVVKNNHTPLRATNYTEHKKENTDENGVFDYDSPPFNMQGHRPVWANRYTGGEAPSGLKGHLSLHKNMLEDADATIMIGYQPKEYDRMYTPFNEAILFGCRNCNNKDNMLVYLMRKSNIPTLILKYPTTQGELINLIERINNFLTNLEDLPNEIINDDNLDIGLRNSQDKVDVDEFRSIVNDIQDI